MLGKLILIIFSFLFFGCNYTKIKETPTDQNTQFSLPREKLTSLSYSLINQKVFQPKCVSCHGNAGNINLETYASVLQNITLIKKSVFTEKTMPKKGFLTDEEKSFLWNWLQLGAPEQAQNGSIAPSIEPLVPTFESINKNIFQVTCKDCHNSTGTGKRILLDKESLLNSPLELVLPENPDESGLIISLERRDDKRMPPAKEGYSALKNEAKQVIRKWIENGAKD